MLLMRMIQAVDACERENSSRCCGGDGCHDKKGDKRGCSRSYMMGGSILAVTTSDAARHRPCTPPFCTSRTEFIHVDGMKLWVHRVLDGKNGVMVVWAADTKSVLWKLNVVV